MIREIVAPLREEERITASYSLEQFKESVEKHPNGLYWYHLTSGAMNSFTNGICNATANGLVMIRGTYTQIVFFPLKEGVLYAMHKNGETWSDIYELGGVSM